MTFANSSLLHIFCILNVDYGVFTFVDQVQLESGLKLIYSNFNKFGLEMHIGRGKKLPKPNESFLLLLFFSVWTPSILTQGMNRTQLKTKLKVSYMIKNVKGRRMNTKILL